ncbi:beta-ketoacyl-ACP synthase III [Lacticaseibacillus saniviri]
MHIVTSAMTVPENVVTNDQLAEIMPTSDEWIRTRTGIRERHIATAESNYSLGLSVSQQLLASANLDATQLDFIIVATMSPDYATPGEANRIQAAIGASSAFAFNINVACSGFVYAMHLADKLLQNGHYGIVIGSEVLSRLVDWQDRSTAVLFGDGSGGVLLKGDEAAAPVVDLLSLRDTDLSLKAGGEDKYFAMNGRAVYQFAIREVPNSIQRVLTQAEMVPDQIDWVLLHQANARIIESVAKKLQLPPERFLQNIADFGNTSAASIPMLLHQAIQAHTIQRGQQLVLSGFGGGLSVGTMLLRY